MKIRQLFEKRKPNLFECSLLVIGVAVLIIGFYLINKIYMVQGGMTWELIIAALLWLILLFHLILTSSSQDIKEELGILITNTNKEIRLLRKDLKKNAGRKRK